MDLTTYGKRFGMTSTILGTLCIVFLMVYFYTLMQSIGRALDSLPGIGSQPGQSIPGLPKLPQFPNLDDYGKGN
jgi:hypothetical protein